MNLDKAGLRRALAVRYPWVQPQSRQSSGLGPAGRLDAGPHAVSAGECDGCGREARLVQCCGPPPAELAGRAGPDWALGRRCALRLGPGAWCDGHRDEAAGVLAWLEALPAEADDVARLWWIATGEVRPDPALLLRARRLALPP